MNEIMYRELVKEDYGRMKELISEAFGFHEFIKDKQFLDSILTLYLQNCILTSSFSSVAVKNNKIIGFILGDAKKDKKRLKKSHNILSIVSTGLKVIMASKQNKKTLKEFSKINHVYDGLIKNKKADFQGCIQLFIVSQESRGLGVGKTLVNHLSHYMKSMDVTCIYLYTDTRCNYGFYENQNFKRLSEKEIYFDSFQEKLNVFLYGYNVPSDSL